MSNETIIGIVLTVIFGVAGFLAVNKKTNVKIKQKTKNGNNTVSNNTFGDEIHKDKK